MDMHNMKLADLHTHLYGCIHAGDFLEFLKDREVDWTAYQGNFQRVYGAVPPVADILERCRRGIPDAHAEFEQLFVFRDEDAGNFDRFQAKYDILNHGSDWGRFSRGEVSLPTLIDQVCMFIHTVIARQRRQNVGYAEHRMNLCPEFTRSHRKNSSGRC